MDIQISAGRFRGKKLRVPEAASDFRPTKQVVREAVCSSLQMDIAGANVLELCAGSGVFSFELLSRGAEHATLIESSLERCGFIRKVTQELMLEQSVVLYPGDVLSALKSISGKYDIIFFDPPYYEDHLTMLISQVVELLTENGVLVYESATDDLFVDKIAVPDGFCVKSKKYGQTMIRFFRKKG